MHLAARHSVPSHTLTVAKAGFGEIATKTSSTDLSLMPGRGNPVGGNINLLFLGDRKETVPRRRIKGGGFPSTHLPSLWKRPTNNHPSKTPGRTPPFLTRTALRLGSETLKLSCVSSRLSEKYNQAILSLVHPHSLCTSISLVLRAFSSLDT